MNLKTESVRYGDGFTGYFAVAANAKTPLPGVIVIQEAWGVDEHIKDMVHLFALAGYAAFAPDVFTANGVRPEPLTNERLKEAKEFFNELKPAEMGDPAKRDAVLNQKPEASRNRIKESITAVFTLAGQGAKNLPPVLAASHYLRDTRPETRGQKIASVGYCMGGGLSVLLATADPKLAGAIIYYGTGPSEDEVAKIQCPVLGFYGATDERVNATIPALEKAMEKHGKSFEFHIYEGAGHAFSNDTRPSYDVKATRSALNRTLSFFEHVLTD
jgi:carboxymethylenebutenolidase